ncbi:inositol 1,4,5-triphosphate receptor associated 2 isoform X2 [Ambystoma mexicanum]|uniref:inositol 1,4,5-triphosphate receptor associated 2 isoform X2 n=1 Tax=Ambystoma mexicanum TaxID=8296 RepID=UPI0037E84C75
MTTEGGPGSSSKRHNPVDSICRKIKTIQMRDQECNPILQIPKFQSRNFDSPQNSEKKNLEVALKNRTVKSCDRDSVAFSSPGSDCMLSQTKTFSPRFMPMTDYHSPMGNTTYSIIVTTKEKASKPWLSRRTQSCSTPLVKTSGLNYGLKSCSTSSLELMSCIAEDQSACKSPSFSLSAAKSEYIAFRSPIVQSPVVKRLSLSEGGLMRAGDMKLESTEVSLICEEDLLDSIFHACDIERRGKVPVSKIVDYLRYTTSRGSEDSGLDDLCNMLDPEKRDISMDLDTYHAIMKEWIDDCRNNGGDVTTKEETVAVEDSAFKMRGSFLAAKRRSGGMNTTSGSLEAFGGDVSRGDLETSDLITCVADLQLNNQKLEVQQGKLKLALEGAEEANNRLMEENEMLRTQVKNAQQYIAKVKSLKEELEETKANLSNSEAKKAQVLAQNKQLEKDNISQIHKISDLQEENIQNAVDSDNLQRKMGELLGNVADLQMQLQDYENLMGKKDASFQKKELHIEELNSSVAEYASVIETLRAEKAKLENSMQQMQQELISHGIVSPIALTFNPSIPNERTSLHSEMVLAQQFPENNDIFKQFSNHVSSLEETLDHEVLLLLQGPEPEKAATEFKMIIQKLREDACNIADLLVDSLQRALEHEINQKDMHEKIFEIIKQELKVKRILWIQRLKILEKHKGSLDQEFAKMAGNLRRLRTEHLHLKKTLSSRVHDLESLKQLHEEDLARTFALGQQLQEATDKLEASRQLAIDRDAALRSAQKEAESALRKAGEAAALQKDLQAQNSTLSHTCLTLEKNMKEQHVSLDALREKLLKAQVCGLLCQNCANWKPGDDSEPTAPNISQNPAKRNKKHCLCRRFGIHEVFQCVAPQKNQFGLQTKCWYSRMLDALTLESLQQQPRYCYFKIASSATATLSFEKAEFPPTKPTIHDHLLCNINKCEVFSISIQTDACLPVTSSMACQYPEENVDHLPLEDAKSDSSELLISIESQDSVASVSGGTIFSEPLSISLEMEMKTDKSNLDQNSVDERIAIIPEGDEQKERGSNDASETELHDKTNQLSTSGTKPETSPQGILQLNMENFEMEAVQEKPTEDSTEASAVEGNTSTLVTSNETVMFVKHENTFPSEKDAEAEFLRLSLGFKCDLFTMEKRLRLEERSRDLAEENLKREITNCLTLLETLVPICEADNQSQDIINKLEKSLKFLSQQTARVASRAEMLGAIHQESRVSKAVDMMIQHVENLKRMYAKEHAELEELKLVLIQNEKSFGSLVEDDALKRLPSSINSKSLRRVSIASFPTSTRIPGPGLQLAPLHEIAGIEKSETFPRRSSSWRLMGPKATENRPSLKRLMSTCAWGDGEEHSVKGNEQAPLYEEVKAKANPMEGNSNTQTHSGFSPWMSHFRTSFSKANKTIWISFIVMVFLAALMSFLAGLTFQMPAETAPVGTGNSWTSFQQLLWPYTGLRHNGQPPV